MNSSLRYPAPVPPRDVRPSAGFSASGNSARHYVGIKHNNSDEGYSNGHRNGVTSMGGGRHHREHQQDVSPRKKKATISFAQSSFFDSLEEESSTYSNRKVHSDMQFLYGQLQKTKGERDDLEARVERLEAQAAELHAHIKDIDLRRKFEREAFSDTLSKEKNSFDTKLAKHIVKFQEREDLLLEWLFVSNECGLLTADVAAGGGGGGEGEREEERAGERGIEAVDDGVRSLITSLARRSMSALPRSRTKEINHPMFRVEIKTTKKGKGVTKRTKVKSKGRKSRKKGGEKATPGSGARTTTSAGGGAAAGQQEMSEQEEEEEEEGREEGEERSVVSAGIMFDSMDELDFLAMHAAADQEEEYGDSAQEDRILDEERALAARKSAKNMPGKGVQRGKKAKNLSNSSDFRPKSAEPAVESDTEVEEDTDFDGRQTYPGFSGSSSAESDQNYSVRMVGGLEANSEDVMERLDRIGQRNGITVVTPNGSVTLRNQATQRHEQQPQQQLYPLSRAAAGERGESADGADKGCAGGNSVRASSRGNGSTRRDGKQQQQQQQQDEKELSKVAAEVSSLLAASITDTADDSTTERNANRNNNNNNNDPAGTSSGNKNNNISGGSKGQRRVCESKSREAAGLDQMEGAPADSVIREIIRGASLRSAQNSAQGSRPHTRTASSPSHSHSSRPPSQGKPQTPSRPPSQAPSRTVSRAASRSGARAGSAEEDYRPGPRRPVSAAATVVDVTGAGARGGGEGDTADNESGDAMESGTSGSVPPAHAATPPYKKMERGQSGGKQTTTEMHEREMKREEEVEMEEELGSSDVSAFLRATAADAAAQLAAISSSSAIDTATAAAAAAASAAAATGASGNDKGNKGQDKNAEKSMVNQSKSTASSTQYGGSSEFLSASYSHDDSRTREEEDGDIEEEEEGPMITLSEVIDQEGVEHVQSISCAPTPTSASAAAAAAAAAVAAVAAGRKERRRDGENETEGSESDLDSAADFSPSPMSSTGGSSPVHASSRSASRSVSANSPRFPAPFTAAYSGAAASGGEDDGESERNIRGGDREGSGSSRGKDLCRGEMSSTYSHGQSGSEQGLGHVFGLKAGSYSQDFESPDAVGDKDPLHDHYRALLSGDSVSRSGDASENEGGGAWEGGLYTDSSSSVQMQPQQSQQQRVVLIPALSAGDDGAGLRPNRMKSAGSPRGLADVAEADDESTLGGGSGKMKPPTPRSSSNDSPSTAAPATPATAATTAAGSGSVDQSAGDKIKGRKGGSESGMRAVTPVSAVDKDTDQDAVKQAGSAAPATAAAVVVNPSSGKPRAADLSIGSSVASKQDWWDVSFSDQGGGSIVDKSALASSEQLSAADPPSSSLTNVKNNNNNNNNINNQSNNSSSSTATSHVRSTTATPATPATPASVYSTDLSQADTRATSAADAVDSGDDRDDVKGVGNVDKGEEGEKREKGENEEEEEEAERRRERRRRRKEEERRDRQDRQERKERRRERKKKEKREEEEEEGRGSVHGDTADRDGDTDRERDRDGVRDVGSSSREHSRSGSHKRRNRDKDRDRDRDRSKSGSRTRSRDSEGDRQDRDREGDRDGEGEGERDKTTSSSSYSERHRRRHRSGHRSRHGSRSRHDSGSGSRGRSRSSRSMESTPSEGDGVERSAHVGSETRHGLSEGMESGVDGGAGSAAGDGKSAAEPLPKAVVAPLSQEGKVEEGKGKREGKDRKDKEGEGEGEIRSVAVEAEGSAGVEERLSVLMGNHESTEGYDDDFYSLGSSVNAADIPLKLGGDLDNSLVLE